MPPTVTNLYPMTWIVWCSTTFCWMTFVILRIHLLLGPDSIPTVYLHCWLARLCQTMQEAREALKSQVATVTPNLYLCGASALKADRLAGLGITVVISCTVATPSIQMDNVECMHVAVEDSTVAKLSAHFDQCADKIQQTSLAGGRTLVHCMAGVSRSATLCIAYLMKHQHMTLREAYSHVKSCRCFIRPNIGFFRQLIDYEKQLFGGKSTVSMVGSPIGDIPDVYVEQTKIMLYGVNLPKKWKLVPSRSIFSAHRVLQLQALMLCNVCVFHHLGKG